MAEARVRDYQKLIAQLQAGREHTPELLEQLRKSCLELTNDVTKTDPSVPEFPVEVSNLFMVLQRVCRLTDLVVQQAIHSTVCSKLATNFCFADAQHPEVPTAQRSHLMTG
jgi:hypothetical protein